MHVGFDPVLNAHSDSRQDIAIFLLRKESLTARRLKYRHPNSLLHFLPLNLPKLTHKDYAIVFMHGSPKSIIAWQPHSAMEELSNNRSNHQGEG